MWILGFKVFSRPAACSGSLGFFLQMWYIWFWLVNIGHRLVGAPLVDRNHDLLMVLGIVYIGRLWDLMIRRNRFWASGSRSPTGPSFSQDVPSTLKSTLSACCKNALLAPLRLRPALRRGTGKPSQSWLPLPAALHFYHQQITVPSFPLPSILTSILCYYDF